VQVRRLRAARGDFVDVDVEDIRRDGFEIRQAGFLFGFAARHAEHVRVAVGVADGPLVTDGPAMTVAVILAGLLPIMLGSGTGSEVMQRIAAPMIGGVICPPVEDAASTPPAKWRG